MMPRGSTYASLSLSLSLFLSLSLSLTHTHSHTQTHTHARTHTLFNVPETNESTQCKFVVVLLDRTLVVVFILSHFSDFVIFWPNVIIAGSWAAAGLILFF